MPTGWTHLGSSNYRYQVLTTIDGEVVAALDQKAQNDAIESVDFFLADLILAPKILVELGVKAGKNSSRR